MSGVLGLPHRFHQHVLDDNTDIRPAEAVGLLAKSIKVPLRQAVGGVSQVHLEHVRPRLGLWQGDVYALHTPGLTSVLLYHFDYTSNIVLSMPFENLAVAPRSTCIMGGIVGII